MCLYLDNSVSNSSQPEQSDLAFVLPTVYIVLLGFYHNKHPACLPHLLCISTCAIFR